MAQFSHTENNKAIYRKYIQEVFNNRNVDQLKEFVHGDYILHNPPPGAPTGPEVIRQIVLMFQEGFPDFEIILDELVAEGDFVVARSTFRGTHQGLAFGFSPTGKPVIMSGLTMVRITDGQVRESWVRNDMMGLMNQLAQ